MSAPTPPADPGPEHDGPPPVPGLEIFDAADAPAVEPPPAYAEAPRGPELAHPALRAVAFAMDGIGTVAVTTVTLFAGLGSAFDVAFSAILVVPLLSAVLSTVLTAVFGVTPAKALFGIKAVDAVTGGRLGWRAVLRSLVIVAPIGLAFLAGYAMRFLPGSGGDGGVGLVLLTPIAGWIVLLVILSASPRYRGLQDRAGRSVVVRR